MDKPLSAFAVDRSRPCGLHSRCRDCRRAHYAANRDATKAQAAAWNAKNRDHVRARNLAYYYANREDRSEKMGAWYAANREAVAENVADYRASRPGFGARLQAKRRAAKLRATPKWADPAKIAAFYELVPLLNEETGVPHHVDHIVPLISDRVCGLHCEANLQVLTAPANIAKGNFWWPDMGEV